MKNIYNIFCAGLLILSALGLASCSEDETFDFAGDPYNRVYMTDYSKSFKVIQTPIGTISSVNLKVPMKCTQKAKGDIKVTVEVDNTMIKAYNDEFGTNYCEIPSNALSVKNSTMTIPTGGMITKDSIEISLVNDQQILSQLNSKDGYLIPIRITTAEGESSQPSTNFYSSFLAVTITNDNVNHDATEADITGTLVQDQTGWTATTNGSLSSWGSPIETIFDGDFSSYCQISANGEDIKLDVNMGKPYTFDAITLYYGYDYGSWGKYEYNSFSNGMSIYTSNNGTDWTEAGTLTSSPKSCVFYAPITAQYVRLVKPYTGSWNDNLYCGTFNVYAK